jgi:hypothetical protein
MITAELFSEIIHEAKKSGKTIAQVAIDKGTNAFALMNYIAENPEARVIFEEYRDKKEETDKLVKTVFKEITYERLAGLITGTWIEEKTVKYEWGYYYPDNDFKKTPTRYKKRKICTINTRFIPPNGEVLNKIITNTGFIKEEKEIAAGTIRAIIEAIKGFQMGKISPDTFTGIINTMPIPETEKQKIIDDTVLLAKNDTPSFEIRTNNHIGWGANEIDAKIEDEQDEDEYLEDEDE